MKDKKERESEERKIMKTKFFGGRIIKAINPSIDERNKNQKSEVKRAMDKYSFSSNSKFASNKDDLRKGKNFLILIAMLNSLNFLENFKIFSSVKGMKGILMFSTILLEQLK